MPKYKYYCDACFEIFEEWHGMKETLTECSKCSAPDCLTRVPSTISDHKTFVENKKVGDLTNESIEAAREDLRDFKKALKNSDVK